MRNDDFTEPLQVYGEDGGRAAFALADAARRRGDQAAGSAGSRCSSPLWLCSNRGNGPTGPIDLMARAPKKRLRVRAPKRRKIANLDPGATSRQAFKLRIRRPARGKVTEIKLLARGPGFEDRQTVVRLRMRD